MSTDVDRLRRVSALFDEFAELSSAARAQRLDELGMHDPDVAQELARWLQKDAQSEGILDHLTARFQADAARDPAEPGDRSGQSIGAYQLLRRVGRGGMGEVYEARRAVAGFEQKLAIKLLRRGLDSADIVQRFLRERRILAQLEHPGIARLVDGGMSNDGQPFLVMEFVDGSSLIEAANRDRLDLDERLQLFLQICDAVAYAHRRLIVHRDLKPSNVLLTGDRQPKLLDFGIAKLLDEVDDEPLTGTGMRVLTPQYAAPEQILGQTISTATDVYALGLILYELLTGTAAHQRLGKDLDQVTRDLERESVMRPSQAVLQSAATSVAGHSDQQRRARLLSGDLDTIVLHALKREPERRYQGAAELADDIRRYLHGHPVRAETDTMGYRVRKFIRRHRGGVTAAALAALSIVAGLVVALWQANLAQQQALRADAATRRATVQAARAEQVKDFVLALFQEQNPLSRDRARAATAGELVERGIARAGQQFASDTEVQAEVVGELASLQLGLGDAQKSIPHLQTALGLHERSRGKESTPYATVLSALGGAWLSLGETERATEAINTSLAILRKASGVDSIETANAESQMVRLLLRNSQPAEALPIAQHAYDVYQRERGALHSGTLQRLYNFGSVLSQLDRLDEAEKVYRQVITGYERSAQSDHAALVYPRLALARTLKDSHQYQESATMFDAALASARIAMDADHPLIGQILLHQGDLLRRLSRYEQAEQAWQEAERVFSMRGMSAELGGLAIYRGALAMEQRRYEAAIRHYEAAVDNYGKALGADNSFTYSAALRLAKARAAAGQHARAITDGRAAHEAMLAIAEPRTFDESHAHEAWAEVLFEAHEWHEAETEFRKALEVHRAINGTETIDAAVAEWQIAETLYEQQGNTEEPLSLLDHAIGIMRDIDPADPDLGDTLLLRGKLLARAKRVDDAIGDWRAARAVLVTAYGEQDQRVRELDKLLSR